MLQILFFSTGTIFFLSSGRFIISGLAEDNRELKLRGVVSFTIAFLFLIFGSLFSLLM